jgi:Na+-translocating ferredoxin:NAD+ oxidoreductase subunit E
MSLNAPTIRNTLEEGLWSRNPALIGLLGLCPLLAVSNRLVDALAMGLATTTVLVASTGLISLLKRRISHAVRLPLFMLVMATMVTVSDVLMNALTPEVHRVIGLFIPLIVTNCAILGRVEAFAYRQTVPLALMDGLAMGLGFTWVICLLGGIREVLGTGELFSHAETLFGETARHWTWTMIERFEGIQLALLPAGAFLLLGLILALRNQLVTLSSKENPT